MKKIIFLCVCFLFCTQVYAYQAACVMDADSNRVLFGQNLNSKELIASTTKIMTALVVINNINLNDTVTVGDEVQAAYGSAIYIKPKEQISVEDLLYGLMMRSGNDAAIVLAKYTAGSIEGFAKLMNDTAMMIGMHDSTFSNPHGLDEETQNKSTVYDMCLLMVEAMKNPIFKNITGEVKHSAKTNFMSYEWYNKNKLLTEYKFATGGKIGYTRAANHTFVSSASKDNKNLVIATFKDPNRFDTHKNLYEKYFDLYKKYTLIDKNHLKIKYDKNYKIYTTSSFSMLLTDKEKKKIKREIELYDFDDDFKGSRIIGTVSIILDNITYKKLNIYGEKIEITEKKSFIDKIKDIFKW